MTALDGLFDRIHRGISGVCEAQDEDGGWRDFEIAGMGASGAWVTAAVGLRLAGLPPAFRSDAVARAVERAVEQIDGEATWSYNHKTPPDADTTAHAMLLLGEAGRVRPGSVERLLGFQTLDGGFSTFPPNARGADHASWSISHLDVTPVCVRALAPHRAKPDVAAAIARALIRRDGDREDGRWPAFWWGLDWYTAAAWARAASDLGAGWAPPPRPTADPLRAPLDAAYLLEVAIASGWEGVAITMADLLLSAGGDGPLWPALPVLRVVAPDVARPWQLTGDQGGRLYADVRGIYSTSVIVSALARHAERFATA
ncbi:MAG: hypothetical protein ABIY55_20585 [Kofleriaceae bacterium]